jgi:TonB family protein
VGCQYRADDQGVAWIFDGMISKDASQVQGTKHNLSKVNTENSKYMYIKTILILLALCFCITNDAISQKIDTTYYKDHYCIKKTKKVKEAVIAVITTTHQDKTTSTMIQTLVFSKYGSTEILKDGEPYGIWRIRDYKEDYTLYDFNFTIRYADTLCSKESSLTFAATDTFYKSDTAGYTAPVFMDGSGSLQIYFFNHLFYPQTARDSGIQGTVIVKFTISKEGVVSDLAIVKSVDKILDKVTLLILQKMSFKTPPMMHGQPVSICVEQPVTFQLMR